MAEKAALLPEAPGVYLFKDENGRIIYIGKAVVLRNRVRSYFQSSRSHTPKVRALVGRIADIEYIVTGNEIEALILECNLIKKHHPKYNISLRDDKSFPYLKVTVNEAYPRVYATRRVLPDGARYFGPYADAGAMHETLRLLKRMFPLRTCRTLDAARPCLQHHIGRCLAPCTGKVDQAAYQEMVRTVTLFLEGRSDNLVRELRRRMEQAAERLEFEQAARLRDQLAAVEKVIERQNVVTGAGDQDALGLARAGDNACVQVFFIRSGKLVGRERFLLVNSADEEDAEVLAAFLKEYYSRAGFIPREVLLPLPLPDQALFSAWLSGLRGGKVAVEAPRRGVKKDLVVMAASNAAEHLKDAALRSGGGPEAAREAAADLGRRLGLTAAPERIECFDISHIQGAETVASMVVFAGGLPQKDDYRRYRLSSLEGKPDDFAAMREVVSRRYRGGGEGGPLPDLIVIDGGKGQLSAALEALQEAGAAHLPVIGLAKEFEHIFRPGEGEPLILPRHAAGLKLLQQIRDEAHRFAITYHRKLRARRNLWSLLEEIPGIGPKRRKTLWDYFGSLAKIREAAPEDLARAPGMTREAAAAVHRFFRAQEQNAGEEEKHGG